MKPLLLIGGGGHARSVAEAMPPDTFAGYAASEESAAPPVPGYVGTDADVRRRYSPAECAVHVGIGFSDGCRMSLRRKVIEEYSDYTFATVISPQAIVSRSSEIGAGTAVMMAAVVNRSHIGSNCVINTGAIIEHDCRIGDNTFIGPGAILLGEVTVGHDSFIGAGVTVLQGVTIAPGVSIGLGSTVRHDIAEPGVYVGNPLRKIKSASVND